MYISEVRNQAPKDPRGKLERMMYDTLEKLNIPYQQVDNDPAASMEECARIDEVIGTQIRKNVFLCNQKKTTFFLLVMPADKPFETSEFSKKLGVSRMSFAPSERCWSIWDDAGSASVAGLLMDEDDYVQVIIDKEVAEAEWFGCNPGINTSHLKFKTKDLCRNFCRRSIIGKDRRPVDPFCRPVTVREKKKQKFIQAYTVRE
ncbi:prolyl-tRNA synthetase associated domain-containing protein [Suipraeoptans intestinalis]|uniref:prolyl-tRNA synthetase associated domain-containing protein n=1 Tax=Suipraeoptans intestinalis TaxID=2606628 RepID=UPI001F1D3BDC|nr:YbaK/EbsC family protein [Suipraeoptans intestinalis]